MGSLIRYASLAAILLMGTRFSLAVSPSGRFEQPLLELQRSGGCAELPQFGVVTHQRRNPDDINLRLVSRFKPRWFDLIFLGLISNIKVISILVLTII